jgi:hypothetical protein
MSPLGTFRDNLIGLAILVVLVLGFLGGGLALAIGGANLRAAALERSATIDATVTSQDGPCRWNVSYEVAEKAHAGSISGDEFDGESYCAIDYVEGDTVTVYYDPEHPASHSLTDPSEGRAGGTAMLALGLLFVPVGVWLLYKGVQQGRGRY